MSSSATELNQLFDQAENQLLAGEFAEAEKILARLLELSNYSHIPALRLLLKVGKKTGNALLSDLVSKNACALALKGQRYEEFFQLLQTILQNNNQTPSSPKDYSLAFLIKEYASGLKLKEFDPASQGVAIILERQAPQGFLQKISRQLTLLPNSEDLNVIFLTRYPLIDEAVQDAELLELLIQIDQSSWTLCAPAKVLTAEEQIFFLYQHCLTQKIGLLLYDQPLHTPEALALHFTRPARLQLAFDERPANPIFEFTSYYTQSNLATSEFAECLANDAATTSNFIKSLNKLLGREIIETPEVVEDLTEDTLIDFPHMRENSSAEDEALYAETPSTLPLSPLDSEITSQNEETIQGSEEQHTSANNSQELLNQIILLLKANQLKEARASLNAIPNEYRSVRDYHYIRALYFLKTSDRDLAKRELEQELNNFSDHHSARELLSELEQE